MKMLVRVSMLISVLGSSQLFAQERELIVGGSEVLPETDTSYIVSIGGICAGSIVAPSWILTAAHCSIFFNKPITAGSADLQDSGRIRLAVKSVVIHPQFKQGYYQQNIADFALIELSEPIDFARTKLSAIRLADPGFEASGGLNEGVMATVLGWGQTSEKDYTRPSKLREVSVPIVSRAKANSSESYHGMIDDTMLVAGYAEGGKDSCEGDSGGPLIVTDPKSGKTLLAGIVSFGQGCARPNYYGVYSDVPYAFDWIMRTVNHL